MHTDGKPNFGLSSYARPDSSRTRRTDLSGPGKIGFLTRALRVQTWDLAIEAARPVRHTKGTDYLEKGNL